jgi:hypothetical protein
MQALDELTRTCIVAVTAEVERGADLDDDESWIGDVILSVFEEHPPLLATAFGALGDAYALHAQGDRETASDMDLKMFRVLLRSTGEPTTQDMAEVMADVIYNRKGGVQDALYDLGVARDWARGPEHA